MSKLIFKKSHRDRLVKQFVRDVKDVFGVELTIDSDADRTHTSFAKVDTRFGPMSIGFGVSKRTAHIYRAFETPPKDAGDLPVSCAGSPNPYSGKWNAWVCPAPGSDTGNSLLVVEREVHEALVA